MIDWDLTRRLGSKLSGSSEFRGPDPDALAGLCEEALSAVVAYSALEPAGPVPRAEAVTRPEWIAANTASLEPLIEPALAGVGERAGPAGHGLQLAAAVTLTVEAGAVLGLLSRKVLGQYDLSLVRQPDSPPPRLLFVAPNVGEAMANLGRDGPDFLRWIALHEVTHAVQFGSVPWLRDHLGGVATELIGSLDSSDEGDGRSAFDRVGKVAGRAARTVRGRDPLHLLMDERERALVDHMQSAMALIEGHAEHVMDRADPESIPSLGRLRPMMAAKRSSPGPLWRVLGKLLGLELKMRQYETGRRFCDGVVDIAGVESLNLAWASPDAIPGPSELEQPRLWLDRVTG